MIASGTHRTPVPESIPAGADDVFESEAQKASLLDAPQRTVLYVEDNPANLQLVSQLLELRPDLRLLAAVDGHLGIESARHHHPDVILMDLNLPGISGTDAMRILQTDPTTASIPIIAFSANAIPSGFEKGPTGGFFGYISKPIRIKLFWEALDAALNFSHIRSPSAAK